MIRFPAQQAALPKMLAWVRNALSNSGLPLNIQKRVELALEEALVNIILHAYNGKEGEIELSCRIVSAKEIAFTLKDRGKAFNPLLVKAPELESSLEERALGGLGIVMMRKYMDEIHYERKDSYNILTLIKKIA